MPYILPNVLVRPLRPDEFACKMIMAQCFSNLPLSRTDIIHFPFVPGRDRCHIQKNSPCNLDCYKIYMTSICLLINMHISLNSPQRRKYLALTSCSLFSTHVADRQRRAYGLAPVRGPQFEKHWTIGNSDRLNFESSTSWPLDSG